MTSFPFKFRRLDCDPPTHPPPRVSILPTHHGKAEIVGHIFGHVDQLPLGSGDQDEAMQGLKKSLVRQGGVGVGSPTRHKSLKGKVWLWLDEEQLSREAQRSPKKKKKWQKKWNMRAHPGRGRSS